MKRLAGSLGNRFRRYFLGGLLVLIPIFITLWIVERLFTLFSGVLARPVARLIASSEFLERPIPLLGWLNARVEHLIPVFSLLLLVALILLTGMIARNLVGARLVRAGQDLISRIPLVRRIYRAAQQIIQAFLSDRQEAFRRAVMVEYPRVGVWSVAFVTSEQGGHPGNLALKEPHYRLFLPSTPNPTTGYLLMVPKSQCIVLDMSVEEALQLVISGGAVNPTELQQAESPANADTITPEPAAGP